MSEIADLIEKMYGHHYTPQTMSNMTKVLTEEVNAFKSRALNDKYVAIFMDATYIPLKRQTVSKEAIYIAIGIREDGTKEVLSYAIAPTESTYVWNELLQDINSRGVQEVLLFITDGLKGIPFYILTLSTTHVEIVSKIKKVAPCCFCEMGKSKPH